MNNTRNIRFKYYFLFTLHKAKLVEKKLQQKKIKKK
jgi:hypothetical protein